MNEMIDGFLKAAKESPDQLNLRGLMDEDEQSEWETLVEAMNSIDILHIGKDLETINKKYHLQRWQELSLLAYIKVLELMMMNLKEADKLGLNAEPTPAEPKSDTYTGSMFG